MALDWKPLASLVQAGHAAAQSFTGLPLAVSEDEAKLLAKALTELSAEYSVVLSRKTVLWCNLFAAVSTIYGPRIMFVLAARSTMKEEQKRAAQTVDQPVNPATGEIINFPQTDLTPGPQSNGNMPAPDGMTRV